MLHRAPPAVREPLSRGLLRAYERALAAKQARGEMPLVDNGLPVPPPTLRVAVVGHADAAEFLAAGCRENAMIREAVVRAGRRVEEMDAILDWGCGCGRLARWWSDLDGPRIAGCDYNPRLVAWTERNLPFVSAATNGLEPPLPYPDATFDLVYALSVVTHLTDDLVRAWMAEIVRVLRPDGLFFFTTHGAAFRDRLSDAEAARFASGESVVQFAAVEGTNLCAAYHPRSWVESHLPSELELVEGLESCFLDESERRGISQDRYVVRRIGSSSTP
jgi:SAM-dependent methyltransferase